MDFWLVIEFAASLEASRGIYLIILCYGTGWGGRGVLTF